VVSDEAGAVLDAIKKRGGFKSLDNAMDRFLLSGWAHLVVLDNITEEMLQEKRSAKRGKSG